MPGGIGANGGHLGGGAGEVDADVAVEVVVRAVLYAVRHGVSGRNADGAVSEDDPDRLGRPGVGVAKGLEHDLGIGGGEGFAVRVAAQAVEAQLPLQVGGRVKHVDRLACPHGGLDIVEPMEQFEEIYTFIEKLRTKYNCNDDVVIYTGYTEKECSDAGWIQKLCVFNNIVIKFGRFVPNQASHYDKVLGVNLASDNQYAIKFNPC